MADGGGSNLHINPTAPLLCVSCRKDGQILYATGYCKTCHEHLCATCFEHHCRPTPTRHHELVGYEAMPRMRIEPTVPDEFFVDRCSVHRSEMIKFYCREHTLLACSVCVALEHRSCSRMDYIPDTPGEILNNSDFIDQLAKLQALVHRVDVNLKMLKIPKTAIETYKSNARGEMDTLKQAIQKFVKGLDAKVESALKAATGRIGDMEGADTADEQWDLLKSEVEDIEKGVVVETNTIPEGHLSVSVGVTLQAVLPNTAKSSTQPSAEDGKQPEKKNAFDLMKGYHENIHVLSAQAFHRFGGNAALQKTKLDFKSMFSSFNTFLAKTPKKKIDPKFEIDLTVKLPYEEEKCQITGATALKNGELLVICDSQNKSVKLIDVQNDEIVSVITLASKPWGVARVTDNHIFISLIDKHELFSIVVLNGLLEDERNNIKVDGRCCGIACANQKFIVSYVTPAKVQVLSMKGEVLKQIISDKTGASMFEKPIHVTLSPVGTRIYTSDWAKRQVLCLDLAGSVLAKYGNVKCYGIATDSTGAVYVGCVGATNSVHLLTEDCQLERVVLEEKDIEKTPDSLTYARNTDRLYVALYDQEFIRQFDCSN